MPVLSPYRIAAQAIVAPPGSVLELGPLVYARYAGGNEAPVGGMAWSITSGAEDGKISKRGKLTCRSTPGIMKVEAKHPGNGFYARCIVTVAADTGGGETPEEPEEPEEPPVEPEPPAPFPAVMMLYGEDPTDADFGDIWTCVTRSIHGVDTRTGSDIITKCEQALAKGGSVLAAQGSYNLYIGQNAAGEPEYQRNLYEGRVEMVRPKASRLKELYDQRALRGIQACDDFAGLGLQGRWKWPRDWDFNRVIEELDWMAAAWADAVPGVDLFLRARDRQFTDRVPQGYPIWIEQYRYWGLEPTPEPFRDAEEPLARARGHKILWSLNFLNGGGISQGIKRPMTPDQILRAGLAFVAGGDKALSVGFGGWMKSLMLEQPEYLAVFRQIEEAQG